MVIRLSQGVSMAAHDDADRIVPLGQEQNLNLISDALMQAIEPLSGYDAGLALIAAGLDLLPAGRCAEHYRHALLDIRAEIDRLLTETGH